MTRRRLSGPSVVLGLCSYTHDSAAALIADGHLVGFCEEERLAGDKHTRAYPARAIAWLLTEAGLEAEQVSAVGYNFQAHRYLRALAQAPAQMVRPAGRDRVGARARSFARVAGRTRARMRELSARFPHARVSAVQHHRAHGLYAFASSGYEDAAVLVADSLGEVQTTTIGYAQPHRHRGMRVPDHGGDRRSRVPGLRLRRGHRAPGLAARRRGGHGHGPGRPRRPRPIPAGTRAGDPDHRHRIHP